MNRWLDDDTTTVSIVVCGFRRPGTAIRLLERGIGVSFYSSLRTWRDPTYPGAACDIPSRALQSTGDVPVVVSGQKPLDAYGCRQHHQWRQGSTAVGPSRVGPVTVKCRAFRVATNCYFAPSRVAIQRRSRFTARQSQMCNRPLSAPGHRGVATTPRTLARPSCGWVWTRGVLVVRSPATRGDATAV
jgi:hypothetical protein